MTGATMRRITASIAGSGVTGLLLALPPTRMTRAAVIFLVARSIFRLPTYLWGDGW